MAPHDSKSKASSTRSAHLAAASAAAQSSPLRPLMVGCILPVKHPHDPSTYHRAEILSIRIPTSGDTNPRLASYYVHVVGWNKRLDDWLPFERLKVSPADGIEWPKEEGKKSAASKASGGSTSKLQGSAVSKRAGAAASSAPASAPASALTGPPQATQPSMPSIKPEPGFASLDSQPPPSTPASIDDEPPSAPPSPSPSASAASSSSRRAQVLNAATQAATEKRKKRGAMFSTLNKAAAQAKAAMVAVGASGPASPSAGLPPSVAPAPGGPAGPADEAEDGDDDPMAMGSTPKKLRVTARVPLQREPRDPERDRERGKGRAASMEVDDDVDGDEMDSERDEGGATGSERGADESGGEDGSGGGGKGSKGKAKGKGKGPARGAKGGSRNRKRARGGASKVQHGEDDADGDGDGDGEDGAVSGDEAGGFDGRRGPRGTGAAKGGSAKGRRRQRSEGDGSGDDEDAGEWSGLDADEDDRDDGTDGSDGEVDGERDPDAMGDGEVDEMASMDDDDERGSRARSGSEPPPPPAAPPPLVMPAGAADEEVEESARENEIERLRLGGSVSQHTSEIYRMKNVQRVQLGRWEMDAWYFSPYPEEFTNLPMLYLCPFCLEYFPQPRQFERHRAKCTLLHPPGNEIYYDGTISFWEVDGKVERRWCRNLSLLSKLFLDHKTVYFDVDPFWYYVMTISDEKGHTVLGYFSKEKESSLNYNLACILTLPCHQRKGYGKLLIAFSYLLSLREGKVGSPEKPLSDLGLLSYLAYWSEVLAERLVEWKEHSVSLEELSHFTGMTTDDVTLTLKFLDALRIRDGRHVVVLTNKMVEIAEKALVKKNKSQIHPDCLHWVPPDARARVGAVAGEVRGLGFGIQQAVVGRSGADEWAKPVPRKGYTEAGAQR